MSNRVNEIFQRLAVAPSGVDDCTNSEVLAALGMMVSAILNKAYDPGDRTDTANRFCQILQACISPTQSTQPLH